MGLYEKPIKGQNTKIIVQMTFPSEAKGICKSRDRDNYTMRL